MQVLLAASPPASTARRMAASQTRRPAPRQRRRKSVLSSSGGEGRREEASPATNDFSLPPAPDRFAPCLAVSKSQPARHRRRQRFAALDMKPTPRPAKSRGLRSPGATDSVRWAWQATAPTHGTWPAPGAPDSPAFHFVPLRYAPVGTALRRTPTAPPKCPAAAALPPSAERDASLRLRCPPLRENRRDRRFPRPAHHRA
jgi:hypothetical protein